MLESPRVAARLKLVLFGGYQLSVATPYVGDTWEWDGATWRPRFVTGPSARAGAMATTLNGKVVLFGGYNNLLNQAVTGWTNDTWEWDGNAWSQRAASGPPATGKGAMATLNGKVILLIAGQTWEWNGSVWSLRDFNSPNVSAPMMTTFANTIVLFGGEGSSGCTNDTWVWNDVSWTKLNPPGALPAGRTGGLMVSWHGRPLLFGGWCNYQSTTYYGDTWQWNGATWTMMATGGPSARELFDL